MSVQRLSLRCHWALRGRAGPLQWREGAGGTQIPRHPGQATWPQLVPKHHSRLPSPQVTSRCNGWEGRQSVPQGVVASVGSVLMESAPMRKGRGHALCQIVRQTFSVAL